jgi:hypothetical protein
MSAARRFPPSWSIEEGTKSFVVKDANGQQLAYLYFEDEPQRQMSMKRNPGGRGQARHTVEHHVLNCLDRS